MQSNTEESQLVDTSAVNQSLNERCLTLTAQGNSSYGSRNMRAAPLALQHFSLLGSSIFFYGKQERNAGIPRERMY